MRRALVLGLLALTLASWSAGSIRAADSYGSYGSSGSSASKSKAGTFKGKAVKLGDGKVWSWVTLDVAGAPTAIGITLTETALTNLPKEPLPGLMFTEHILALPAKASATPFTHAVLNWNPHGHIPAGVYTVPHFDFHFYMCPPKVRAAITGTGDDLAKCSKAPPAGVLPASFITQLPATIEPRMGNHWVDSKAPEFNGKPFTYTWVYGSYDGKVTFYEPMITRDFLLTKPNLTADILPLGAFPAPGWYPTKFRIAYDGKAKTYTAALEGFVKR